MEGHIDTSSPEFQNALTLIRFTQHSLFLTGKAGTGKSTFLRYVCSHVKKKHVVLAPTGIAAINAHTNLDMAPGGINEVLAQRLALVNIRVADPSGTDAEGREWGLIRMGEVPEQPLEHFLNRVKTLLGCEGLRYVDGGKPVKNVAVGGGACGDGWREALDAGCDTFVTSDIKYNQFWDAQDLGMNLIDAGHFYTENPITACLAEKIAAAFPDVEVKISESHRDCVKYY